MQVCLRKQCTHATAMRSAPMLLLLLLLLLLLRPLQ